MRWLCERTAVSMSEGFLREGSFLEVFERELCVRGLSAGGLFLTERVHASVQVGSV